MMMRSYAEFLAAKRIADPMTGIASPPDDFGAALMLHQDAIARWALRRGRAAVFAGTGLGKTRIELVWGREVAAATTRPVLCLAPLAVGDQHAAEAARIGIDARQVERQDDVGPGVNITNYQKLERFDLSAFGGIILDESSILKAHDGHYRTRLIEGAARIPFRLAATATPSPNDFTELGNHAEFLGAMRHFDMLATFFTHDGSDVHATWRLKGHAGEAFWSWMASWAVMLEKPSDLGFPDDGYDLPPLVKISHEVAVSGDDAFDPLGLAPVVADRLGDRLKARRDSVDARVATAIALTPPDRPFVWWGNLNAETEAVAAGIAGAVEVRGSESDEVKRAKLRDFSAGRIRVLVTKPSIAGFGMNWQHCADTGFVGLSDSFEQVYQAIRRFWRFGQTRAVTAHFVHAASEGAVIANLDRKERDAARMMAAMIAATGDIASAAVRGVTRDRPDYAPELPMMLPSWPEFAR